MKFHLPCVLVLSLMLTACGEETPTVSDGQDFETSIEALLASEPANEVLPFALKVIERRIVADANKAPDSVTDAFDGSVFPVGDTRLEQYALKALGDEYALTPMEYRLQQQIRGRFLSKVDELDYKQERRKRYEEAKKRALYADKLYRKALQGLAAEDILPKAAKILREDQAAELAAFDQRVQKMDDEVEALKTTAKSSADFLSKVDIGFLPNDSLRTTDRMSVEVNNRSDENLVSMTLQVIAVTGTERIPMDLIRQYRVSVPAGVEKVFHTTDYVKSNLQLQAEYLHVRSVDSFDLAIIGAATDQGGTYNTDIEADLNNLDFARRTLVEERYTLLDKQKRILARLEPASNSQ